MRSASLYSALLCSLILSACSEFPDSLSLPDFAATLTVPLIDSTLRLDAFLSQASFIQKDATSGNYAIVQDFDLPTFHLADSLNIQAVDVVYQSDLNSNASLQEALSGLSDFSIGMHQIDSAAGTSGSAIVQPSDTYYAIPLHLDNGLQRVHCSGGTLGLDIQNSLPVDLTLESVNGTSSPAIVISTPGQANVVCSMSTAQARLGKLGSSNSTVLLDVPVNDAVFSPQSTIIIHASSAGSNGRTVSYNEQSALRLHMSARNTHIHDAVAQLHAIPIDIQTEALLPQGTKISEGVIRQLVADLSLSNDYPTAIDGSMEFPQITNTQSGKALSTTFHIDGNGTQRVLINTSGQSYAIAPDAIDLQQGATVRSLHCHCMLTTQAMPNAASFNDQQLLRISGRISPIVFSSVSGYQSNSSTLKFSVASPFSVDIGSAVSLSDYSFQRVQLLCSLMNSSPNAGILTGTVSLYDSKNTLLVQRDLGSKTIGAQSSSDLSYVFSDIKLNAIPTRILFDGVISSMSGQTFQLNDSSAIHGTAQLRIPLTLQVKSGAYDEMSTLHLDESIRSHIQSLQFVSECKNRIRSALTMHMEFYDDNLQLVQRIPAEADFGIPASVGQSPMHSVQRIAIDSLACSHIMSATRYRTIIHFATDSDGYAQFQSSDSLAMRVQLQCTTSVH